MITSHLYSITTYFHLFHRSVFELQSSVFNLQSSIFGLPTPIHPLPSPDFQLLTASFPLPASISLIDTIQIILLAGLLLYALYYAYETFFGKTHQPRLWKQQLKAGNISKALQKAESRYKDSIRFFTWWFAAEQLKKQKVAGSFAELGVYKGDSAEVLHLMDESRPFHLFDTFSGFQAEDLEAETGKAAGYTTHHFADTSLERVKQRLNAKEFIFHPGKFAQTCTQTENEQFALVNMDVDLYQPTKTGLEFFFPRLNHGGAIFVHDYNPDWPGIVKAVDEFSEKYGITLIHIPDTDDSVVIVKS